MRMFLAVLSGYAVFAVSATLLFQLTQQDPRATPSLTFAVVSVVWGMLFAALGGYLAVRGANRDNLIPGVILGCVIATGALISLLVEGREGSPWTQLSTLLLIAPSAVGGGLLRRRKPSSDTTATDPGPSSSP